MKTIIYVMILGALGAICRFALSWAFPEFWGTLTVNLIGCFFLALSFDFLSYHPRVSPNFIGGLTTGFLGAFTTFSAFSMENVRLFYEGEYLLLSVYVLVSLLGGLTAALVGKSVAEQMKRKVIS